MHIRIDGTVDYTQQKQHLPFPFDVPAGTTKLMALSSGRAAMNAMPAGNATQVSTKRPRSLPPARSSDDSSHWAWLGKGSACATPAPPSDTKKPASPNDRLIIAKTTLPRLATAVDASSSRRGRVRRKRRLWGPLLALALRRRSGRSVERARAHTAKPTAATLAPCPNAVEALLRRVKQDVVVGSQAHLEVTASVATSAESRSGKIGAP